VSIWMSPYSDTSCYVVDILFVLMVLKLFVEEATEIARTVKREGCRKGLNQYFGFKRVVDWASLVYSFTIFGMWASWCMQVSNLNAFLADANADIPGSWASPNDSIHTATNPEYWEAVDSTSRYGEVFQIVLAFYPFVVGARFFSVFSAQPRLAMVTSTLLGAASDIFHFGVVLAVTITIYCVSAEILFGRDIVEFENFGRSFITVFRALLGDFDYVALTDVSRFSAGFWWMSFMCLVNMVMLNMLLAIIMDVYSGIKGGMDDEAETILSQSWEIFRRWNEKRRGLRVSLGYVLAQLESNPQACFTIKDKRREPKLITKSTMMDLVPGITPEQSMRILTKSHELQMANTKRVSEISDCLQDLYAVDVRVQRLEEMVDNLGNTSWHFSRSLHLVAGDKGVVLV